MWEIKLTKSVNVSLLSRFLLLTITSITLFACVTTPPVTAVPPPDVSSDSIDSSIRRPVPVFEATPQEGTEGGGAVGTESAQPRVGGTGSSSQTVVALLDQANAQQQAGHPERAAAVLERALRIEPKNANLWHQLAVIRLQQGRFSLAQSLAAKSSSLASDDWQLKEKNNQLIQQARRQSSAGR